MLSNRAMKEALNTLLEKEKSPDRGYAPIPIPNIDRPASISPASAEGDFIVFLVRCRVDAWRHDRSRRLPSKIR